MASVSFSDVTIRYPGAASPTVSGLDLEIKDGEFLVLVGPSGCGKSTVLRSLAGLEPIESGAIFIGDKDVSNLEPADRDIAMVFQNYALYPHMSVADNMGFSLKLSKMPKDQIRAKVEEAAEILGLTPYLDRKPKDLSGGQRQRVAMGRAIVRSPQVFLMDEPLSNLDAKLRVQTRTELAALQRRLKTTTVYVTHDQVEAMTMGDRVAVLKDGLLQQVAPPRELYDHPANEFVAGFIGSPSMNFLPHSHPKHGAVTLGIRPEHVRPHNEPVSGSIRAVVDIVEELGSESYVYAHLAENPEITIVSRQLPGSSPAPGTTVYPAFDLEHAHFFSKETGQRLD
ncbi:ATP-binding cassette domain-containing protein [Corynebacterium sp. H128]|uniref:ABC transporter ATP-binding protein n=1 Tax=unclassified Corynebacterium TaxID=2624378 RepID=UPI0030AF7F45